MANINIEVISLVLKQKNLGCHSFTEDDIRRDMADDSEDASEALDAMVAARLLSRTEGGVYAFSSDIATLRAYVREQERALIGVVESHTEAIITLENVMNGRWHAEVLTEEKKEKRRRSSFLDFDSDDDDDDDDEDNPPDRSDDGDMPAVGTMDFVRYRRIANQYLESNLYYNKYTKGLTLPMGECYPGTDVPITLYFEESFENRTLVFTDRGELMRVLEGIRNSDDIESRGKINEVLQLVFQADNVELRNDGTLVIDTTKCPADVIITSRIRNYAARIAFVFKSVDWLADYCRARVERERERSAEMIIGCMIQDMECGESIKGSLDPAPTVDSVKRMMALADPLADRTKTVAHIRAAEARLRADCTEWQKALHSAADELSCMSDDVFTAEKSEILLAFDNLAGADFGIGGSDTGSGSGAPKE